METKKEKDELMEAVLKNLKKMGKCQRSEA